MVVLVVATITFFLMRAVPGNVYNQDRVLNPVAIRNIEAKYHLDEPLMVQYLFWLRDAVSLDFGVSMVQDGRKVNDIIRTHFPVSAAVGMVAILISLCWGVGLGIYLAVSESRLFQGAGHVWIILGLTLPNFALAALLQYIFSVKLHLFPVLGTTAVAGLVLPILTLAVYPAAFIAKTVYYGMLDALRGDYVVAARARGIAEENIIYVHALKNSILPVIAYLGPLSAGILVGSFAIETVFNIPGLGRYYIDTIISRDYTGVMGLTVFFAFLLVIINLAVEGVYSWLDPRIGKSER